RFSRDWSSDVCSSDLVGSVGRTPWRWPDLISVNHTFWMHNDRASAKASFPRTPLLDRIEKEEIVTVADVEPLHVVRVVSHVNFRSEERRVGNAWGALG